MKHPKTCIFCGNRGSISKEHFWPEWLAPHLAPAHPNSHVTEFRSAEGKQPPRLERRSERPGAVNTKKIRVVCATCNTGWMSALESKVKPVFLALLEGSNTTLSSQGAANVALWVTVKSIVGEHATESTALTTPADRLAVLKSQLIPDYFRIFVALHSLETQTAYYRQSTTVSKTMRGPDPPLPSKIFRNIQATTFLVGPVCIYVTAARVAGFSGAVLDPVPKMHRLWPDSLPNIELAALRPLAASDVSAICRSLDRLVADPRVKYGGPLPRHEASAT